MHEVDDLVVGSGATASAENLQRLAAEAAGADRPLDHIHQYALIISHG